MQTIEGKPLGPEELEAVDAFWRAANYLSVGQIYLLGNPLLREPLEPEHVKARLLGHWGTTPGVNLVYTHASRAAARGEREMMYVCGPGHAGPGISACTWLEGSFSRTYPSVSRDAVGMARLLRNFSFPGGMPSHVAAEVPGSIHEGGELGYSLSHAFGSVFDNPDLVTVCIIGDGEAETGALATSWHSTMFLDPVRDGAVLPVLHLNGYKIANPAVLDRLGDGALTHLLEGYGYVPYLVEGDEPEAVHQNLAATVDHAMAEIERIQRSARDDPDAARSGGPFRWPVIVLRTPKGWTGPHEVDGKPVEGTWRAHQVPVAAARTDAAHRDLLERWLRSYRPDDLFDSQGCPRAYLVDWLPEPDRCLGASPHANGGLLLHALELPPVEEHAVAVDRPGGGQAEATRVLGGYLRDVMRLNDRDSNFRVFGPDETASNRLDAIYEASPKAWQGELKATDEDLAPDGRVMEILSEHTCQGWLEGYLLTGRHGLFSCYEAFVHIVDSMFNQHAKWLKVCSELPWRQPIASLNYLLTSHVWRQDHNGFSHQDPGFIDHVVNKKADVIRVYLPPDANTLLCVADQCLSSRNLINVIVAGKQRQPVWLAPEQAAFHCHRGIGIWEWASSDGGGTPDVVLACAGDVPTLETLAAVDLMRHHLPDVKVRVVNVVDLMRLQPASEHPHGLPDAEFDALFTTDRPVIFAYHGYPWLVHRLTYRRTNHPNLHVRGYKEEGTTTTPFDMVILNDLDRYHLVMDVIDRVPGLGQSAATVRQRMVDERYAQRAIAYAEGQDPPAVRDWVWSGDR